MGKSVFSLFALTLAATLCDLLLPERSKQSARGVLRLLTVAATLFLLLTPIFSLFRDPPTDWLADLGTAGENTAKGYEELFQNAVSKGSAAELRAGLHDYLQAEHGIEVKDAQIYFEFGKTGELFRVRIRLSGKGLLMDPSSLKQDVEKLLNCSVEVR